MPQTPIDRIARELVRMAAGEAAAERFDDALEDYGPRRALEEAGLGLMAGLVYQQALRQADRRAGAPTAAGPGAPLEVPLVEGRELPEDDPREGLLLHVDVPHTALEVQPVDDRDDALWLYSGGQATLAELPIEYDDLEWRSEPGSGTSRIALLREGITVPAEDDDEAGEKA